MCAMNAARILVVDDELALRRLMRLYLTKAGFTVEEASTGPKPWRYCGAAVSIWPSWM